MRVTRVYRFSASHRLHSARLTEDENRELYGKCNNPWGHGHDYVLHVTIQGPVEPVSGRVAEPGALDRYVNEQVLCVFSEKDMNEDVPGFDGVPTTENLAHEIVKRLKERWGERFSGISLARILIEETPRNKFELRVK